MMHKNKLKRRVVCIVICTLGLSRAAFADEPPAYLNSAQPIEKRVDDLLARLTLEEKVSLTHGNSIFNVAGVPRLGIPELTMDDGPMGVREDVGVGFRILNRTDDYATALPAMISLAATFDVDAARSYGGLIGEEARARGKNIMLGPSINIQRTPLCGRNFEYLGEDPYLTSRLAVNYILAEQAQGVASCVKHFAANNQETQRGSINVEMDERTLREIYLPAFRAAVVEGKSLAIMGAYNRFRGAYCCENEYLLDTVLRGEWQFKGLAISDWGGVHSTDAVALHGVDIEMGTRPPYERNFLGNDYLAGLKSGKYPMSTVDDRVRRFLTVMFKLNLIGATPSTQPAGSINTREHQLAARDLAEQSMVLLKNDPSILPLDLNQIKSIAVIGDNAVQKFAHGGAGATIKSFYEVSALEGIVNRVGSRANVTYASGYAPLTGTGRGRGAATQTTVSATDLADRAIAAAKQSDVVIYVGGLTHGANQDSEGTDRRDLSLPGGQAELISRIIQANPRTIVVLNTGAGVEMGGWLDQAPAVLEAWYGGMEAGNALARILFGDANPSGKLPCTFPKTIADSPAHAMNAFPGTGGTEKYEEGLLVGYRWFDEKKIAPLFPFGHGLSYTAFGYSDLKLVKNVEPAGPVVTAEFKLTNTGKRDGAEVVQLYVHDVKSSLPRPMKELKGFQKVTLKAGESKTVSIPLSADAFAFYDPQRKGFVAEAGAFTIQIGGSSASLPLQADFELEREINP